MYRFSKVSQARLDTCHPDLRKIMELAIAASRIDFGISCGWRSKTDQDKACHDGLSKTPWPTSRHNRTAGGAPSSAAVDVLPYLGGVDLWTLIARKEVTDEQVYQAFNQVWGVVKTVADSLGIKVRWGADWDRDGKSRHDGDVDERFVDLPHIELDGV